MEKLSQQNLRMSQLYLHLMNGGSQGINIECDQCGHELYDSSPDQVLTSYPPKKKVHCKKCGFEGYRIL
jgi:ribosomal protein S27E